MMSTKNILKKGRKFIVEFEVHEDFDLDNSEIFHSMFGEKLIEGTYRAITLMPYSKEEWKEKFIKLLSEMINKDL